MDDTEWYGFFFPFACAVLLVLTLFGGTHAATFEDGVVYLEVDGPDNHKKEQGSGLILGKDGFIVTAMHLLDMYKESEDTINVSLLAKGINKFLARRYQCTDVMFDSCLLYVNSQLVNAVGLRSSFGVNCAFPHREDKIIAAGYRADRWAQLSVYDGIVAEEGLVEQFKMVMSNHIDPGMSGGPVVNKSRSVVGLVWGADRVSGRSYFIPLSQMSLLFRFAGIECPIAKGRSNWAYGALNEDISTRLAASVIENGGQLTAEDLRDITKGDSEPSSSRPKVFLQVGSADEKPAAAQLVKVLTEQSFDVSEAIEESSFAPEAVGEVKYFSLKDHAAAENVRNIVQKYGKSNFVLKSETSHENSTKRVIEVWVPHGPLIANQPPYVPPPLLQGPFLDGVMRKG